MSEHLGYVTVRVPIIAVSVEVDEDEDPSGVFTFLSMDFGTIVEHDVPAEWWGRLGQYIVEAGVELEELGVNTLASTATRAETSVPVAAPELEDDGELFDDDGYPTDSAIERIKNFSGTTADFLAYVQSLWWHDLITVEAAVDDWGRAKTRVSFVTGGWSGNEMVMGAVDNTMFHFAFWAESKRGGLTVYEIPESQLTLDSHWGAYDRFPVTAVAAD